MQGNDMAAPVEPRLETAAVTFAIPYYSTPHYLVRAIESVMALRNPAWRLQIYDDNPADPLDLSLIEPYLEDPRVAYTLNPRQLGIAGNWNQCLSRCSTPLLTILHSDDMLMPDYLDRALQTLQGEPSAWAYFCGARIIDEQDRPRFSFVDFVKRFFRPGGESIRLRGEAGADAILRGNFIMCPTLCYRMEHFGELRFDERWRMVLDLDLYLRVLGAGGSLVGISDTAFSYRRHDSSQTAAMNRSMERFSEEVSLYLELADSLALRGWHRAATTARRFRIVRLHLLFRVVSELLCLRPAQAGKFLKLLRSLSET